jgi:CheY-like chemotaxis protein
MQPPCLIWFQDGKLMPEPMVSQETFFFDLRTALNHLYDPDFLRESPLSFLFGIHGQVDAPKQFQKIVLDAIQKMRPSIEEPVYSQSWHIYNILLYRYIQRLKQEDVANQLGTSLRQIAREQSNAVKALGFILWEQFRPDQPREENPEIGRSTERNEVDDLSWLSNLSADQPSQLDDELATVAQLARPLAEKYGTRMKIPELKPLPPLQIHPVVLRQILISLVNTAIHRTPGGDIQIKVLAGQDQVQILIDSLPCQEGSAQITNQESLELARQMAKRSNTVLVVSDEQGCFQAALTVQTHVLIPVLAIDDNQGILDLYQRFADRTAFEITGVTETARVFDLIEKIHPRLILLDVMMPKIDGWQFLGLLREHPKTGSIPVIISTIMAEEELAYSLGAMGFLRKPVTKEKLLDALSQAFAGSAPELR